MLTYSRLAYQSHDHQRCVETALEKARVLCEKRHIRLTPIRKAVLKTIWTSHQPLGAYDVVDNLALNLHTGKRIKAPTVYRAIEFLLNLGLIHRIASLNAYIGRSFPEKEHNDFFLICRICRATAECNTEQIGDIILHAAERVGFQVELQVIEVNGLCPRCQQEKAS
ncbi:MAG: Fur family zinc uptake transcriptional regulator [Porticoccus sp.]